jgi:Ca2+-transporting ATPase
MKFTGLSSKEAKKLQIKYGLNKLPSEKPLSALKIYLSQFTNPLVYILVVVGIISFFMHEYVDIIFIFSVVILNSFFGFIQEYKAQKTFTALKDLLKPIAKVIRGGKQIKIDATELVPGDIVLLVNGDKIPADGEVVESASLLVNEAILTGESEMVIKNLGDAAFMGTSVSGGRAMIRITNIGINTKIGEIAQSLQETEQPKTPLQFRLKKFTRTLIYISLFLSSLILIFGVVAKRNFLQMVQMASIVLVAIIPEALLVSVTLILVIGMRNIFKKKALVRKMLAVETFGSITTICTDKTGTITLGKMKLETGIFADREKSLLTMCLCNDLSGSEEIALWDYLQSQKNYYPQETFDKYVRSDEIPFDSSNKYMATVNYLKTDSKKNHTLFVKGAAEIVLGMSNLSEENKKEILVSINNLAKKGLKVMGLAYKDISENEAKAIKSKIPSLEWIGLIGLWDPPRKEVKEALTIARAAGIKIKIITGDYRKTAEKVMDFIGLKVEPKDVIEGLELEKISDENLKSKVLTTSLFTRITPKQKLRIVKVLQELGEIVAMTGDGVNDAPALKKASIGIVVNEAQDVAKETADVILLNSNFQTIVSAVEEGRKVFENIKKVIFFMLSDSFAEVVLILGSIVLGWPMPLTILQILWIHLLCDGPEDFVLAFEPREKEVMIEGPKGINEPLLNKTGIILVFIVSILSGLYALTLFWYFGIYLGNLELGRTMVFMAISFDSVLYIFACRSLRKPFWSHEHFWSNKPLFAAVIFSLILQISICYIPLTQNFFGFVPLNLSHWSLLLTVAILIVIIIESTKTKTVQKFISPAS